MKDKEPFGFSWAYRDLLTALVIVFLALAVMVKVVKDDGVSHIDAGVLTIEVSWPYHKPIDVDTWVSSPKDSNPTSFMNTNGKYCDLLHDDRGISIDAASRDIELVGCRQWFANEQYIVNIEAFKDYGNDYPIPVTVKVYLKKNDGSKGDGMLLSKTVTLEFDKHEITVFRFKLDEKGKVIEQDSVYTQLDQNGRQLNPSITSNGPTVSNP